MSKQGLLTTLLLSALLASGSAGADPEPAAGGTTEAAAPGTRAPDPALGRAIAEQGNAALREIRADSKRQLAQSLRLPELTPPSTEVANTARPHAHAGTGAAAR